MLLYIKISDIVFSIDYSEYDNIKEEEFIIRYLHKYLLEYICDAQEANYNIKFRRGKKYIEDGKFIFLGLYHKVYDFDNITRFVCLNSKYDTPLDVYTMDVSKKWEKAEFIDYITKEDRFSDKPYIGMFIGLYSYIQCVLLQNNSFFLHGVALQYNGKGLVFSAASGVGKTTHTNFWAENFGAEILNGDTPIIKLVDGKPFIYGSPWCGTSDISVNKVVPLDAIVIISRCKENKIRKLNKFEAVGYLFNHMRRPAWDEESTNICLDYCETIINTISIYKLECLPNSDAAEVARRGISELNEH